VKDSYFFKHDSNARHDPKILAMRSVYGAEGYGWFWILIEMMRESAEYKLDLNGKYSGVVYSQELGGDAERVKQFIDDCINEFELFATDSTQFWSERFHESMQALDEKRNRQTVGGRKGGLRSAKGKLKVSSRLPQATEQNRTDKKREEKREYAPRVFLTEEEYRKLGKRFGESVVQGKIEDLSCYLGNNVPANKYKDHYLTLLKWLKKDAPEQTVITHPICPECGGEVLGRGAGVCMKCWWSKSRL